MTIALASMGVPPSLPNWDQLKYEGSDYLALLAAQAIEDETGIPAELTESQLKDLGHMAVDQMTAGRNGGNPAYTWVTEYLGFEPASVTIDIVKNGLDLLPPHMVLRTTGGDLVSQQLVPLPRRFPLPAGGSATSRLRIPVVQFPQLKGIASPYCFTNRYGQTTCTPSFFPEPICVYEHFVGSPFGSSSSTGFEVIQYFGNCQIRQCGRHLLSRCLDGPLPASELSHLDWVHVLGWAEPIQFFQRRTDGTAGIDDGNGSSGGPVGSIPLVWSVRRRVRSEMTSQQACLLGGK